MPENARPNPENPPAAETRPVLVEDLINGTEDAAESFAQVINATLQLANPVGILVERLFDIRHSRRLFSIRCFSELHCAWRHGVV